MIGSMNITIEEALRMVGEKAAMLRFVAEGLASARECLRRLDEVRRLWQCQA